MHNGDELITFEPNADTEINMKKEGNSYYISCQNQRISYYFPLVQVLYYQRNLFRILSDAAIFFNTPLTFSKKVLADFSYEAKHKKRETPADPVTDVVMFLQDIYPEIAEKIQKEMDQYHFQKDQFILCDYDINRVECEAIVRCKHLTDIRIKLGYEFALDHLRISYVEFDDSFSYSYLEKEWRRRKFKQTETLHELKQFLLHHPKLRLSLLLK